LVLYVVFYSYTAALLCVHVALYGVINDNNYNNNNNNNNGIRPGYKVTKRHTFTQAYN